MPDSSLSFVHEPAAQRVLFQPGGFSRMGEEADRLGLRRLLVLTTKGQARLGEAAADLLGERAVALFPGAVMHTPVEVTDTACALAADRKADGIVAIGGGSTVGLSKAIALRTDLPQIVLPTTYAGSEMTDLIGQTAHGEKKTERTRKVRPETVIYDVHLTMSLPASISALSGMNAIAHAMEAMYAPDGNPIVSLMAEEAVFALNAALPAIIDAPASVEHRNRALYGAWLAGTCLGSVTMGLHHKLCHVLGGKFDLPHAEMHTVLLPYSLAFNAKAAGDAMERMGRAMGAHDPVSALRDLQARCGAPAGLHALGMPAEGIEDVVAQVAHADFANPRAVEADPLRVMLWAAHAGNPPQGLL